ncbi:hypothetical protein ACFVYR_25750 [Streptomyces sp. NPDC058284]|uniref:hypothetical protein n=1 Tax=unclassified Streptomyces TaxID=2593676 RepID=UPI003647A700
MFSKLSRYRTVPDVVSPDARGRILAAKGVRPLPGTPGALEHTVDSGDRLDQLAASYYGQPLHYWHICDANPLFLSPLELLGQEPVTSTHFPLTTAAKDPPWAALIAALSAVNGVRDVTVAEDVELVPQTQTVSGQQVTVIVERFTRAVVVTYHRIDVQAQDLTALIAARGFDVGPPVDRGRLGQPIAIPAAVSG